MCSRPTSRTMTLTIRSKDGVVTLTGTVAEESHKALARETVASLPGVKSVDNKLEVKGEVPAVYSDAWLITKVKSTLLFHRNVSATGTEVFAEKMGPSPCAAKPPMRPKKI